MAPGNKIAILIDGDNAESGLIEQYISEAGRFGRVTVKRIYADWTDNRMKSWKEQLNKFAIRPIQKFAYTTAKNSTDTALIIDAMDLLHSKLIDGICIVSSDSDYTGLAHRIREEGLFIMGIGKSHTPEAFVKSCEIFTFSEILEPLEIKETRGAAKKVVVKKETKSVLKNGQKNGPKNESKKSKLPEPKEVKKIDLNLIGSLKKSGIKSVDLKQIERAFQMVADLDTGQALLSRFSDALRKVDPTFDHRNFGYSSLKKFCDALKPNYQTVLHEDGQTISIKKLD
jgi:uncharacterized LabA/DUF88 family protein